MSDNDKKISEKIMRCLDFIKKECPGCYEKMKECCQEEKEGVKK